MISIYLTTFNDSFILPYTVAFYKSRFPKCSIVIYDNFSDDNTQEVAHSLGCVVKQFYTSNEMDDGAILRVKDNCWKDGVNRYAIVCDADEWLDIWPNELDGSFTIINAEVIDMVGMHEEVDMSKIKYGVIYDHHPRKMVLIDTTQIEQINYAYGCHNAMPVGNVKFAPSKYYVKHHKFLSPNYIIGKNKIAGPRLSNANRQNGLSFHLNYGQRKIDKIFKNLRYQARLID